MSILDSLFAWRPSRPPRSAAADVRFEIDFRAGGQGQEFLLAGWSYPETDYTWTLGKRSILRFPIGDLRCDWSLEFSAGPLIETERVKLQRLFVEVNGTAVAKLISRGQSKYELFIPAEALGQDKFLEIVFHVPDACSPSEIHGSGDSRELGFRVFSLKLQRITAGAPLPGAEARARNRAILMDIQSLGENCELGFVQRQFGAEPLGLFRWASTPLPNLLKALDARFEGLGRPENIVVEVDGASEFQVVDRKYGFRNHSFAFSNVGATREMVLKREQGRLPFLTRLLVEDLETAAKLFCFHDAGRSGLEQIQQLVDAIGRYGPNVLLWVCPAPDASRVGTAEVVGGRLIRGYIDRFQPLHDVRHPSHDAWMGAIRAAHAVWADVSI